MDRFTSKTFVYLTKSRNLLSRKLKPFYQDIQQKGEQIAKNGKMRLQTDLEFRQNEIKKWNKNTTWKCLAVRYVEQGAEQKI